MCKDQIDYCIQLYKCFVHNFGMLIKIKINYIYQYICSKLIHGEKRMNVHTILFPNCDHRISFTFRRKVPACFFIILSFPLFSPPIANDLAGELVFPLRQDVTLPTHNIKQSIRHRRPLPLPTARSQITTLQFTLKIKEMGLPLSFLSALISLLPPAGISYSQRMLLHTDDFICLIC